MLANRAQSILIDLKQSAILACKRLLKRKLKIEAKPNLVIDKRLDALHCPEITKKRIIQACEAVSNSLVKPARKFLDSERKSDIWQMVLNFLAASVNTKKNPEHLTYSETVKQEIQKLTGYKPENFAVLLNKASKKLRDLMTQIDGLGHLCLVAAETDQDILDMPE